MHRSVSLLNVPQQPGEQAGTGHRWSFGHIKPTRQDQPVTVDKQPPNWVTDALFISFD